jgi:hypothetical protein
MSLVLEPVMLFKKQAVRRDLRKFSGPIRFPILLNLNNLSDCGCERGACLLFCYVQSRNAIENK